MNNFQNGQRIPRRNISDSLKVDQDESADGQEGEDEEEEDMGEEEEDGVEEEAEGEEEEEDGAIEEEGGDENVEAHVAVNPENTAE